MSAFRSRWDVTPKVQLPPDDPMDMDEELGSEAEMPNNMEGPTKPVDMEKFLAAVEFLEQHKEWMDQRGGLQKFFPDWLKEGIRFQNDLTSVIGRVLPARYVSFDWNYSVWGDFFVACLLYDPPAGDLLAFAAYRDPEPLGPRSVRWSKGNPLGKASSLGHLVEPLIREVRHDPYLLADATKRYYDELIAELGKRHLKKLGLDVHLLLKDIRIDTPRLLEDYEERQRMAEYENTLFIEVDGDTTEEDVREAFRAISAAQETRPARSRPKRDRLMCVEAAILHDKQGFSYERLAERYGWSDPTLASKYIAAGREILSL